MIDYMSRMIERMNFNAIKITPVFALLTSEMMLLFSSKKRVNKWLTLMGWESYASM